jgi:8-oxo-dGTP pyrophosphatase MutT (NUDIX family)
MRKTKVVGFSLPPQTEKNLKKYLKKTGKTRSELMREMIDLYFTVKKSQSSSLSPVNLSDLDLNKILKLYYEMMGMNKKAVIVIGLGIIVKGGKVLIGQRKGKDPHIKDLSWVFPGGRFNTLDFRQELKREVKEETNLDVEVLDIIHARLIPDSPEKKVRVVAQYFHCKPLLSDIKPGGDLIKLKWVKATSVCKYFTTSTADEIMHFLGRAV